MPAPADARIRAFHALHRAGCFVMPNPWDPGSARLLAALGFPALATTSAGYAWTLGQRDNGVALDGRKMRIEVVEGGGLGGRLS